jgi:hypothetical protein
MPRELSGRSYLRRVMRPRDERELEESIDFGFAVVLVFLGVGAVCFLVAEIVAVLHG